jgi:4a-hydroxytetrahydrobiopterin dehydratase
MEVAVELASERCEACQPGAPQVPPDEEATLLEQIPKWRIVEADGVKHLRRRFRFEGWQPEVDFTNQVAALAEEADHHPAIRLEWGKVTVEWWTHAIQGLHRNDFIMAARVDNLRDTG